MQLGKHSPRWKQLLQLDRAAVRRDLGLFLVEGPKLLAEALRGHYPLRELVYDPARFQPSAEVPSYQVSPDMLDRLSDAHQGVVAVAETRPWPAFNEFDRLVVADHLADPGNLGTLLRTAWAAGVDGVLCLGGVDPHSPKVVRASAGAVFHLPCPRVEVLPELTHDLWGLAPRGGRCLYEMEWPRRWGLVVGNEAHGLSSAVEKRLCGHCTIPMEAGCESLNAAVSAAIVLFEWRRTALA